MVDDPMTRVFDYRAKQSGRSAEANALAFRNLVLARWPGLGLGLVEGRDGTLRLHLHRVDDDGKVVARTVTFWPHLMRAQFSGWKPCIGVDAINGMMKVVAQNYPEQKFGPT